MPFFNTLEQTRSLFTTENTERTENSGTIRPGVWCHSSTHWKRLTAFSPRRTRSARRNQDYKTRRSVPFFTTLEETHSLFTTEDTENTENL